MMFAGILLGFLAQEPLPVGPYDALSPDYFRHDADVRCAAIPAGSRILVTLDANGTLSGWDHKTGRRIYSRPALPKAELPQRMCCSPEGSWLAFSARSAPTTLVRVFSVATGEEVRRFDHCRNPVFSPDGQFLAGSDGNSIRRWSIKSGAELPALKPAKEELGLVAYSPDGTRLAADLLGSAFVGIWDLKTQAVDYQQRSVSALSNATGLAFAPDGKCVLVGTPWGIEGVTSGYDIPEPAGGPPFFFSPDGKRLIAGFRNKRLSILEYPSTQYIFEHQLPVASPESIEISQEGTILLRISGSGVRLEPIVDRAKIAKAPRVTALALLPGGEALIGDALGVIREWQIAERRELRRLTIPDAAVHSFSADGRRAMSFPEGGPVRVWDVGDGRALLKVDALKAPLVAALSSDGESLAVGLADGTVSVWDMAKGKERLRIAGELAVTAIAWSFDGRSIAWGDLNGGIGIADSRTGGDRVARSSRGLGITSLALSPDGRILVTGDRGGNILSWSDDLGREPDSLGRGYPKACSPDGRWLGILSGGNQIALRSMDGQKRRMDFEAFREQQTALAFSADGSMFLTGSWEGSVLLWRVPEKK